MPGMLLLVLQVLKLACQAVSQSCLNLLLVTLILRFLARPAVTTVASMLLQVLDDTSCCTLLRLQLQ